MVPPKSMLWVGVLDYVYTTCEAHIPPVSWFLAHYNRRGSGEC